MKAWWKLLGFVVASNLFLVLAFFLLIQLLSALWAWTLMLAVAAGLALGIYAYITKPLLKLYRYAGQAAAEEANRKTPRLPWILEDISQAVGNLCNKLRESSDRCVAEHQTLDTETERLHAILNSISDGVVALDKDRRIVLFNKAASRLSGHKAAEALGQPLNKILPLRKQQRLVLSHWLDECKGIKSQHKAWENMSFTDQREIELPLDVEARYSPVAPDGIHTIITFRSRTDEKTIEDMKVDFMALAGHELRTPITVIKGYLEIMDEELGKKFTPQQKEFMRNLQVATTQLSGSINNILHVSHIEHGDLSLTLEPSEWGEIVKSAAQPLEQKAAVQEKKLKLEIAKGLPKVAVDRISITEVINNLVDNAIKYSRPGQTITVRVGVKDGNVSTEVIDNGVGIPEDAMSKLFSKFYRSHRTKDSYRGIGLGLYMSKAIVEAHGGHVWVASKEGEGSTFGFNLAPVAKDAQSDDNGDGVIRGVHGWIKNRSLR